MREEPFEVAGLRGHRGGSGRLALLLHGGPGMSDYLGPLAEELDGLFESIRYTQRGTAPSTSGPPYTVETHVDHFGIEQAWAVGHSWGGHLALHLAVAHPERVLGLVCINALGASSEGLDEFGAELRRRLPPADAERVDTLTGAERMEILWPAYLADPRHAPPVPDWKFGLECNADTFASLHEHFANGTLAAALPRLELPALFVHGAADPFPSYVSARTAELIPGAELEELTGIGHFPWVEQPGVLRGVVERFLD